LQCSEPDDHQEKTNLLNLIYYNLFH